MAAAFAIQPTPLALQVTDQSSEIGPNCFNQALSNAVVDINDFAPPPAFTPGNAGRNIMTGPGALFDNLGEEELRLSW